MNTLTFKTNINCGGCIAKVTPSLNAVKGIDKWEVDTTLPQKVLSVQTKCLTSAEIIEAVKSAGFNIEPLKV